MHRSVDTSCLSLVPFHWIEISCNPDFAGATCVNMDTKEKVCISLDEENDKKTKSILIIVDEKQETELKDFFLSKN